MKLGPLKISSLLLGALLLPILSFAQVDFNKTPDDDLGNVEDNFQNHFFEALKHKGIENYDRAIKELKICLQINDKEAIVYFELGKSYVQLKDYGAAEEALKKAISMDNDNEWYLDELYGVYDEIDDYDKALKTVKLLVKYHPDYKEDLARLYLSHEKYKAALRLLDEIDEEFGINDRREALRNDIYNASGKDNDRIEYLEERITNNPKEEHNYLNLIFRHSQQENKKEAFETAKKLLKNIPDSHLVHLALYKFYLDDAEYEKAISSMKLVLNSPKVKPEAKTLVLNDFVKFVQKNPKYERELLEITKEVIDNTPSRTHAEMGQYYVQKGNKEKALDHYKAALKDQGENYNVIKNTILLQIDLKHFEDARSLSKDALDLFPSQPLMYLLNGVANNSLNRPKDALESLEIGVDYIIDDPKMERDFYLQLSAAYRLLNNISKAETFAKKAQTLQNTP